MPKQNARVVASGEAYSSEALQPSRTLLRVSVAENFSFDQLTSMIISYFICPLLPNFPFASSPTVFYPDLEAFLSGGKPAPDVHIDVPSATQEGHSDIASAADDPSPAQHCREVARSVPHRWECRCNDQQKTNKPRENRHTTHFDRRHCRYCFPGTWEAVGDQSKERIFGCFFTTTSSRLYGKENDTWEQRVPTRSNHDECILSRSASGATSSKRRASDQLPCDDAAATNEIGPNLLTGALQRPVSTAEKLRGAEAMKTIAGSTTKMMTLAQLTSVAASLSLDRRLLVFILLALPWAVMLAFYIYVPRRMRRQIQWLFPNVLVLGVFLMTLAACLQWRFSIIVDLIVLTVQICSWLLLAFLGSTSGSHGENASIHFAGKCEPDTAEFSADQLEFFCEQGDRRGGTTVPGVLSGGVRGGDGKRIPAASAEASATTDAGAPLLPQNGYVSPQRLNDVVKTSDLNGELPAMLKEPVSNLNLAACVRHTGKRKESDSAEGGVVSQAGVRVDQAEVDLFCRRLGEASAVGGVLELLHAVPNVSAAGVSPSKSEQTENAFLAADAEDCVALLGKAFALGEDKDVSNDEIGLVAYSRKDVIEEEKRTFHASADKRFALGVDVEGCQHRVQEDGEKPVQREQQKTSTLCWKLSTTPETAKAQRLGSKGLNLATRDEADTTTSYEPSTAVGQEQEMKASRSYADDHKKQASFASAAEKQKRAHPSLLLEEASKGLCVRFEFAPAEGACGKATDSNEECEKSQEYTVVPEHTPEEGTKEGQTRPQVAEKRTLNVPLIVEGSSELATEKGRAAAAMIAGGTQRAPMTAQVDGVSAVEARCECAAVSAAGEEFTPEDRPLLLRRMEENSLKWPMATVALIKGRHIESDAASHHPMDTGSLEEQVDTISMMVGERCGDTSVPPREAHQYETVSCHQEAQTSGSSVEDVLRPFLGCSGQADTSEEIREEHEGERGIVRSFLKEERETSVSPWPDKSATIGAVGGSENFLVGFHGPHNAAVGEDLRFWPNLIEEQTSSCPLQSQASPYRENDVAGQGGCCGTRIATANNLERTEKVGDCEADAECDISFAEMFFYDPSSEKFFSQDKEVHSSLHAACGSEGLPAEEHRTSQRPAQQQAQGIDWSLTHARGIQGLMAAVDSYMWPSDSFSVSVFPGVVSAKGEGREEQHNFSTMVMPPGIEKKTTEYEDLGFTPSFDNSIAPKEKPKFIVGHPGVDAPEKQHQEPELLKSQQMMLQSHPQQELEFFLPSEFEASIPLMGNETETTWGGAASPALCLLGRKDLQSGGFSAQAVCPLNGEGIGGRAHSTTAATAREFLGAANALPSKRGSGVVDISPSTSATALVPTISTPENLTLDELCADQPPGGPLCEANISIAEYPTENVAAAPVASTPYLAATPADVGTDAAIPAQCNTATPAALVATEIAALPVARSEAAAGSSSLNGEEAAPQTGAARGGCGEEKEAEIALVQVCSRADIVAGSLVKEEPPYFQLDTTSPGLLPTARPLLATKRKQAVIGADRGPRFQYSSELRVTPVARQHVEEVLAVEKGTKALESPRLVKPATAHLASRAAAVVVRSRAARNSYASNAGGSSGKETLAERRRSAESCTTMQHYMALVKECYRSRDSQGALRVLELLQKERRVQPDTQLLNYVLLVCVAAGSKNMTERLFNLMEESGCADLVTYNTVLKGCVEAEDLASAEKLLQRMQSKSNISPDGVTFNLMVNACVVCHRHDKAWEYIDKLKAARLTVNVCEDLLLLSTCLDACSRLGEYTHLKSLLESFEKSNLRLNAHAYGTVIKAYGRLGEMRRVWTLWQQQLEENITPTNYLYGCMLDCLAVSFSLQLHDFESQTVWQRSVQMDIQTNSQVNAALKMFQEMIHAGIVDAMHFSVLVKGLSKHRGEGARSAIFAYRMLKRFQNNNRQSHTGTRSDSGSTLMIADSGKDRSGSTEGIEGNMQKSAKLEDDLDFFVERANGSLKSTSSSEEFAIAASVISISRSSRINCYIHALNTISYNALLHLCVSTGYLYEALQIFEDMQRHPKAAPDLITYSSIIKGLCCSSVPQGLEMALDLFHDMQQRARIKADAIIYNTLIQGAATRKRVHLVELLLQHMIDHGVPPSSYTLCQCVKLYGKCYNLARVLQLHEELPSRFRFEVDEYVHTALITACCQNGAPLLAARFALTAYAAQQQLPTNVIRKVLLDLQQWGSDTGGEVCDMQERRAIVDQVISEIQQVLSTREVEELKQQQQQHQRRHQHQHQQQHPQRQNQQQHQQQPQQQPHLLDARHQRGGMNVGSVILAAEAEKRKRTACKSSSCTYPSVVGVSTRVSGVSAVLCQQQQGQQHGKPPLYTNNKQQQQSSQVQWPRVEKQQLLQLQQSPHGERPRRSEGGKQQHCNVKRMSTRGRRNDRNKLYQQLQQTRGKEVEPREATLQNKSASASALEVNHATGKEVIAAAYSYRPQATAPTPVSVADIKENNNSRASRRKHKTNLGVTDDDGRRFLNNTSTSVAGKIKGVLRAYAASENATRMQDPLQAASRQPACRRRRYCY